jgi:hypothetical protein
MAFSLRETGIALPPMVRAAVFAAWRASLVGAAALTALFTVAHLVLGTYGIAQGHMKLAELPEIVLLGSPAIFALSLLFSFFITVPLVLVITLCVYPFLNSVRAADRRVFGMVGFLIGALVWLGLWWAGPTGNLYFGSWISVPVIGGLAGCAGGLAFAQRLSPSR